MKRKRLLHIHTLLADNWGLIAKLISLDPQLECIYTLTASEMESLLKLSPQKAQRLYHYLHSTSSFSIEEELRNQDIFHITIWDKNYPVLLKEITDPPFVLYGKGNATLLNHTHMLAIVGTRQPSTNGINSLHYILRNLLREDWVTVSGLAYGIDINAHITTLEQGRSTIAVLGGGLSHIYPLANYKALQKWNQNLLLLSEYPPSYTPQKWYFPKRNRIISGLSRGVLIVEAQERSGSLITADCALDQNREVFALPGPIHLSSTVGSNRLIQQGAKLVVNSADIVEELTRN
ncbi:DNA-processing protein DprA [Ectobacillus sp. sgz5001026]|uniref:DNA-processing protein DprA n=1 Tax=Ectobacillus sp. sgz5001026 TaxID=3242473 RepID=UPI0036D21827